MLAAAQKHLPFYYTVTKNAVRRKLVEGVDQAEYPYEKAMFWQALAADPSNANALLNAWSQELDVLERSFLAQALSTMLSSFSDLPSANKGRLAEALQEAMISGDAGAAAIAAQGIDAHWDQLSSFITKQEEIKNAQQSLEIPSEIETYNEMEKVIARLEGSSFSPRQTRGSKEVDWTLYDQVGKNPAISIQTTKGEIEIELFADLCPLSSMNFVELTREGYFDGKIFHRVVPNFVIQTGCPRGDGYGSLDYNIRSELASGSYNTEGMIGMASAGPHTESSQWFITHSPTLHLDGRYSLFGKVKDGMDVVHAIRVGDKIEKAQLINTNNNGTRTENNAADPNTY